MCLHVTLKYNRTFIRTETDGGGSWSTEVRIYKCEICTAEFEVIER